ncbi:MAG: PCMD domain-containing protein [Prevotella sp.]|nr:PCMD domain-containing protein [Prevotella sp.]MBQ6202434.1 PCMD domain-containing protein [Prevotella sp.]
MKKIFTLLLVAMTAVVARATDYIVPVRVVVNDVTTEQLGEFSIVENDGLYDISLKNFMLDSENGPMGVGNVELKGVQPYQDGKATLFLSMETVTITDGDDPNVVVWMASMLPPVNVLLRGKIEDEHLYMNLDIDLMETLGQLIQVAVGEGYQMPNPSFELWHPSDETHVEPDGWHSFETATGALAAFGGHHLTKSKNAHSGEACARIYSSSILGIVANGTMTTGRLNADAMIATDPANNAYLDTSMPELDGAGKPFYIPLYSRPDSIAVWVRFRQGSVNPDHPYANISAVITDGTYYQDPEDKVYTNVVAKAKNDKIATTDGEWVRVTAPFVYTENAVEPKAILVTISTNADAGQGSDGDEVLVDDIELIYNAKVTGLKINGQDVPGFSPDVFEYEMELEQGVTTEDIEVVVEGQSTHVIKDVSFIDSNVCTVMALGGDMKHMSTYVIREKGSGTGIRSIKTPAGQSAYYMLDGRQAKTLAPGRIYIRRQADGTVTKILR